MHSVRIFGKVVTAVTIFVTGLPGWRQGMKKDRGLPCLVIVLRRACVPQVQLFYLFGFLLL